MAQDESVKPDGYKEVNINLKVVGEHLYLEGEKVGYLYSDLPATIVGRIKDELDGVAIFGEGSYEEYDRSLGRAQDAAEQAKRDLDTHTQATKDLADRYDAACTDLLNKAELINNLQLQLQQAQGWVANLQNSITILTEQRDGAYNTGVDQGRAAGINEERERCMAWARSMGYI